MSKSAFRIICSGGRCTVAMPAELVVGNRQRFKESVLEHAEANPGSHTYLIDFRGTSYIDSSGLSVLTSIAKKLRSMQRNIVLANLNEDLTVLFQLTKLEPFFEFEPPLAPPPTPPAKTTTATAKAPHLRRLK